MKKRMVSVLLAVIMVMSLTPIAAFLSSAVVTGQCSNPDLTWTYDASSKTLTISGVGPMYNDKWLNSINGAVEGSSPWDEYDIGRVIIKSGVTSISDYAFLFNSVRTLYIPLTVNHIGAFESTVMDWDKYDLNFHVFYEGSYTDWGMITEDESGQGWGESCPFLSRYAIIHYNYSVDNVTRTLSVGCKGDDVKAVQEMLSDLGYLTVAPDGIYGAKTRDAVIAFQAYNGLESPDGKVGNWTKSVLSSRLFEIVSFRTLEKNMYVYYGEEETVSNIVKNVQKRLVKLGYLHATPDGSYGNMTYQAVVKFQKANGIYADGKVGRVTAAKLYFNPVRYTIKLSRTLCYGNSGSDVKEVQEALVGYGFLNATPDGKYGPMTEAAVKLFQAFNGLATPDGKVGNWTLGKLNGNPYTFKKITSGYQGNSVKIMQTYLKKLGYLNATPDGKYGPYSAKAVKRFRAVNGLALSNEADLATMLKIFSRNNVSANKINLTVLNEITRYYKAGVSYMNKSIDNIYAGKPTTALAEAALSNGQFGGAMDACGNYPEFAYLKSCFSSVYTILHSSLSSYSTGSYESNAAIISAYSECMPYLNTIQEVMTVIVDYK